jgi:hypothetical protein
LRFQCQSIKTFDKLKVNRTELRNNPKFPRAVEDHEGNITTPVILSLLVRQLGMNGIARLMKSEDAELRSTARAFGVPECAPKARRQIKVRGQA